MIMVTLSAITLIWTLQARQVEVCSMERLADRPSEN